jgi:hypothetical protein
MTPNSAEKPENQTVVRENLAKYYAKAEEIGKKRPAKFAIGNLVRIQAEKGRFARSYDNTFTHEVFKISGTNTNLPIPMYQLTDYYGKEQILGSFYEEEMQKVRGNPFKVEVLFKRMHRLRKVAPLKKQVYVHWLGYNDGNNEWINDDQLYDAFDSALALKAQANRADRLKKKSA